MPEIAARGRSPFDDLEPSLLRLLDRVLSCAYLLSAGCAIGLSHRIGPPLVFLSFMLCQHAISTLDMRGGRRWKSRVSLMRVIVDNLHLPLFAYACGPDGHGWVVGVTAQVAQVFCRVNRRVWPQSLFLIATMTLSALTAGVSRETLVVQLACQLSVAVTTSPLITYLRSAHTRSEIAREAKAQFLANMSHEIRTPLTAILGYVEALRRGEIEAGEERPTMDLIGENGAHLLAVINDILDVSQMEQGKLRIDSTPCSLAGIVDGATRLLQARARAKGLELRSVQADAIPAVRTDPTRVRQILMNLLANAIKFTETGEVCVTLGLREPESDGAPLRVYLEVRDTGIGIAPEHQERIFGAFEQADSTMTRRFGGSGLGLSIAAGLARALGGRLQLTSSAPGVGSCFTLELVLERAGSEPGATAAKQTSTAPTVALRGQILVADDSADNRKLACMILRRAGLDVDAVADGQQACEAVRARCEAGTPYDLVLMDVQMPELDGHTATRRLREEGFTLPILAFTAHALAEDRERALQAGCDDLVTKPIDRARLLQALAAHLKDHGDPQ